MYGNWELRTSYYLCIGTQRVLEMSDLLYSATLYSINTVANGNSVIRKNTPFYFIQFKFFNCVEAESGNHFTLSIYFFYLWLFLL